MAGVPDETIAFLTALRRNNDKAWFDAHRDDYERVWLAPARDLVEAFGDELRRFAPDVRAEPRVNRSIFRINRDTRFSKDKTPYKDHLDLWFWEGERRGAVSGFYLRITPEQVGVGVGAHRFDRQHLHAYRDRLADPQAGARLLAIVDDLDGAGFPVHGEHYKRVPRGYDPDDEDRARLLRFNALWSATDTDHPGIMGNRRFIGWCVRRWERQAPLHRWLVDEVGAAQV